MAKGRPALLIMLFTLLMARSALADVTYSTSGSDSDGAVAGTAVFSVSGSDLYIILTDTSSVIGAAGQVLTGLDFTVTGGSGLTLIDVTPTTYDDCSSGTCTSITEAKYVMENGGSSPLHGWVQSSAYLIEAKQLHPNGIVNPSVVSGNPSITGNHNPYLGGPVTFEFSFTTAPSSVTAATFHWGTTLSTTTTGSDAGPTALSAVVPEPASVLLLGTVFLALASVLRRKRAETR